MSQWRIAVLCITGMVLVAANLSPRTLYAEETAADLSRLIPHSRSALLAHIDAASSVDSVSTARHVVRSAHGRDELWRALAGHPAPSPDVLLALIFAAQVTGVDLGILMAAAWKESAFRPGAAAPNSTARGLFQFTEATWRESLARFGARHGLPPPGRMSSSVVGRLRHDPWAASVIAAEAMSADGGTLARRLGRPITQAEAFLTHFLGLAGAERFLRAVAVTPQRDVREVIPIAFANNRARFPQGRGPIAVRAAYDHLIAIIESRRTLYLQLMRLEYLLQQPEIADSRQDTEREASLR